MDNFYLEEIRDHYENPSNHGELDDPDVSHEEDNPLCGDHIRIDLKIQDGVIEDVAFSGHGCTISQASASMLTEEIKGKSIDEVRNLTRDDVMDMLGIPLGPVRIKCATLPLKAIKAGVYRYKGWELSEDEDDEE